MRRAHPRPTTPQSRSHHRPRERKRHHRLRGRRRHHRPRERRRGHRPRQRWPHHERRPDDQRWGRSAASPGTEAAARREHRFRPVGRRERSAAGRTRPLARDTAYDFWLSVGPPERGSIEERARELLPDQRLEAGARFEVIVEPYPGELEIDEAARVGELLLDADGQFSVGRQPIAPAEGPRAADAGSKPERRLRFPIRTPATFGPSSTALQHRFPEHPRSVTHRDGVDRRPAVARARAVGQRRRLRSLDSLVRRNGHRSDHIGLSVMVNANGD